MEIIKKNWKITYSIDWKLQVENVPVWIPENLFFEIWDFLSNWWEIPKFDNNRNIIHWLYMDYILIEYDSKNNRDLDIKNNEKIEILNFAKSKIIWEWNQIAENMGEFEYNWKYYLVTYPYNPLSDEINPEKWVYKWVIVNSNKYFEVETEIKETSWKINDIL